MVDGDTAEVHHGGLSEKVVEGEIDSQGYWLTQAKKLEVEMGNMSSLSISCIG